ncbi:alpha-L-fucosidase [Chitinophaga skermanii]|nr:alpha-L-fucosidase [Chitinophaga skermanii]
MKKIKGFIALCLLFASGKASAQIDSAALQQWKDQKFSMFIHFGMYSQLGGVWDGKNISRGLSEQIQAHAGIYSDTYAHVANSFNPTKWNPDSIALLAKAAGMRSIVITSKHHDGFSMYNTAYSDFDVVDATPYKKDILKGLSEACAKHGLRFALYFSLIDWHFPQAMPISSHNSDFITPEHHEFNKKQVTELLTNYGPVSELWFDMGSMSVAQSQEMRDLVHRLQPNCMIGSRIGNNRGDFDVMGDNQEPDYAIGVPWQSPASFFDETWGYRSWQVRVPANEKYHEKLTSLIRVASRGGNFLLNIGPKGDGSVVPYEDSILRRMGAWLTKNGEAIYSTQPDPFHVPFNWGSITTKNNKIYLHIMRQPENNTIVLPGLKGTVGKSFVLGDNIKCKATATPDGVTIVIPKEVTVLEDFKVVVLEMPKGFTVPPVNVKAINNQPIWLNGADAFKFYSSTGNDYNTRYQSTIKNAYTLAPAATNEYTAKLYYSAEEIGKSIDLQLGNKTETIQFDTTGKFLLPNNVAQLKLSPIYLQGPLYSGITGTHGSLENVDINKPWPNANGKTWVPKAEWQNGQIAELQAGPLTAYYAMQIVESPIEQSVLVKVTSGDGVIVFLNGQQALIGNNLAKKESVDHYILLHLVKGTNQLAVKFFNNFQKKIVANIDFNIPQVGYVKTLPNVNMQHQQYFPVNWKLAHADTPHEDLGLVNMVLEIAPVKAAQ